MSASFNARDCQGYPAMLISIAGFILLNIALVHYFFKLKKNKTPKKAMFLKFSMLVSSTLSIWALVVIFTSSPTVVDAVIVLIMTLFVLSTSAMFTFFLATKATPIGDIKVSVDDQLIPFKTENFNSDSLMGKRTLLKFYRGSWCPYCSAELKMFEELKPKLDEYDIQILGVSNDSVEEQKAHQQRDNLSHTLVSDPELTIIRQYGVEHHKGIGAKGEKSFSVFGISMPFPWQMKYQPMSIPTSILIDENGKIVWIDQSEDYRLRASEKAVMGAVKANFGKKR